MDNMKPIQLYGIQSMNDFTFSFITGNESRDKKTHHWENINPATEEILSIVHSISDADFEKGISEALTAQREWRNYTGTQRGRILLKTADLLRAKTQKLALIETEDTGKPIQETLSVDITSAADALEYFGGIARSLKGDSYQLGSDFIYTRREPLGVVAGIGAWNYPLQIAAWKAAPALAAGNAMIFKPSELTPRTAIELAKIFIEAGLPKGLFQVYQGDQRVGKKLVNHPSIKKISLTGEVNTGIKVMEAAASTLKHLTFELGGKSPLIIFDDASLDLAVQGTIDANFFTQGEVCSNGTRVFVHKKIAESFKEKLIKKTQQLKLGDPLSPETTTGALISKEHQEKVLNYIQIGKEEGARILCGGRPWGNVGYFVEPTIFDQCHDKMTIVKEEIFGPVISLLTFEDDNEVIERANDTPYGLAAGIYTQNIEKAHRTSTLIEAGICWINTYNETPVEIPFGGYKMSGIGRENSEWALLQHTQIKTVFMKNVST